MTEQNIQETHCPASAPRKIRVGITHGDCNGIGYELIFKAFAEQAMFDLCTPIVYGSPQLAAFHKKALNVEQNFHSITAAPEAQPDRLNVLACFDKEVKVEYGVESKEVGMAAYYALERAVSDYRAGLIDVLVTAPIHKNAIQSGDFHFKGHTEYLAHRFEEQKEPLMILCNDVLRVALATTHLPIREVADAITQEGLLGKMKDLYHSLRHDFLIPAPRIAVLGLNPHCGDGGVIGQEEQEIILPAVKAAQEAKLPVFGPFAADGFFGKGLFKHFDAVLAMYHDQGLAPFKTLADGDGVNFTAGLSAIRTSPDHGTAFDIAGKGEADERSFRRAIYMAIDIYRNRQQDKAATANPLPKLYHEHREDSDRARRYAPLPHTSAPAAPRHGEEAH